jgi:hypothetical protein
MAVNGDADGIFVATAWLGIAVSLSAYLAHSAMTGVGP